MELQVHDLHKSFDGREVLHGISFSISSGKALGLLGRNGAGKSTTIRILMDVFKADQITISGICRRSAVSIRRKRFPSS